MEVDHVGESERKANALEPALLQALTVIAQFSEAQVENLFVGSFSSLSRSVVNLLFYFLFSV